ncbi:ParA family protein [Methylobacter sp. BlB1]|jgi:chromosome partitioning protein|uniref:ParA family protein n=1 Tax=Methylobacter sp. BlB1 TaxID=2785914 RepID=UPI001892DF5C|nr:ParA family protein [Methylobacter sp. BlB1]MBF6649117.1 AAA family ATPase [Methylobacter sp. BlB1]
MNNQAKKLAPVIVISNNKGGVGKSTGVVNIAAEIGERGYTVLVIDVDPQANASTHISVKHPSLLDKNATALFRGGIEDITESILTETNVGFENVNLIPGSLELDQSVEESLRNYSPRPYEEMRNRIEMLREVYDVIIIDTPPSLRLLTGNALAACTHYLIPIETSSQYPLYGVSDLIAYINRIKGAINPDMIDLGILISRHDDRRRACKAILETVSEKIGNVLPVVIHAGAVVGDASIAQVPVRKIDKDGKVAKDFADLADYIIKTLDLENKQENSHV